MKKLICIILVALMLLACVPFTALGAVSSSDVCKIGETGYATLDAAIDAVTDGQTITLLKNATLSKFKTSAINYTIDGNNKAYTIDFAGGNFYTGNANATFKNVKINMGLSGQSIITNGKDTTGDITFDGCDIKAFSDSVYRLDGRGNFTLRNSSWDKMTGDATAFYSRGFNSVTANDECNFTVENSTITNYAGSSGQTQNNCIFHWNSYDNGNVKIHLKGNTTIKNATETANASVACLFYNERSNAKMIIYADDTVQLKVEPKTAVTKAYFIYTSQEPAVDPYGQNGAVTPGTPTTVLYGNPKFITTSTQAQKGIYMPLVTRAYAKDGSAVYTKWNNGSTQLEHGAKYTGSATSFTPVADASYTNGMVAFRKNELGQNLAYFSNIDDAISAAKDKDTIVIISNNAILSKLSTNEINYAIDGQGHTLTTAPTPDAEGAEFEKNYMNIGNANVTFKNLNLEMGPKGQSIIMSQTDTTGDITFDNCHIKAYNNSFYKLNGKGNFTLKNSTWDKMTGNATVFYIRGDHADVTADQCVITIDNSTITNHAGNYWQIQNNCIFHLNSANGTTVKFYLKGNTVLNNASETANLESACIFYNQCASSKMIINAESTVKFQMNANVTAKKTVYFIYSNPTSTASVKIVGTPKFEVSDSIAKQGFRFFSDGANITYNSTDKLLGFKGTYTDSATEIFLSDTVASGKITKGISVQPVTFKADDFAMLDGAAIRTQNGRGIRFSSYISNDLLDKLSGKEVSFGTLIAHNEMLGGEELTLETCDADPIVALDIKSNPEKWQVSGDNKVFRAALIGFPNTAKAFTTQFAAKAYMTVTYDDGTIDNIYTDFDSGKNIRSMYNVAVNLQNNTSAVVEYIKNTVTKTGTLTLNAPAKIYTNYPAISIETVFSNPEMAEPLTFTTNNPNVKVENGKIYATGITDAPYTVTVTANSRNFRATAVVTVETYQGTGPNNKNLHLETQIGNRQNQIAAISGNNSDNTNNAVLFVGDSFFDPDNFWTSFYADYGSNKAYTVGISSTTAEDWQIISERLVYPYTPKAVVLHIGTNDIFDDKLNAADTTERLQTLLNTYHKKMPDTKIYWFNIEPRVGQSFAVPEAVNANMAEFAKGKDWLVVIDSASWCFTSGGAVDSSFFKDGVHPQNAKYALYRQALTDAGLNFDTWANWTKNSLPNLVRTKNQTIGQDALTVAYNGANVANKYLVTGTLTITGANENAHAEFRFNGDSNRFLIWDSDSDKNFGIGWCAGGSYTKDTGNEEYVLGSSPIVLEWKLLFTEKNAYLYIGGKLKAVFYNVPTPSYLVISSEYATATYTNMKIYTQSGDAAVYNEALAAVSSYEANAGSTTRAERVG